MHLISYAITKCNLEDIEFPFEFDKLIDSFRKSPYPETENSWLSQIK